MKNNDEEREPRKTISMILALLTLSAFCQLYFNNVRESNKTRWKNIQIFSL